LIFRYRPRPARGLFMPNPPEHHSVEAHDDLMMSLWLADLGVNGLMAKEQRKTERQDRRQTRRREKMIRHEIDGPVRRQEPKVEVMVSEAAKEEARRRLTEALERAGVGIVIMSNSPCSHVGAVF